MRTAAEQHGGSVEVRWTLAYEAFQVPEDSPVLKIVRDACADVGLTPRISSTGGGSDGSVLAAHGAPTLVLACGMRSVHSTEEHIVLGDLEGAAELVRACIVRLARERR
jgi:tripeptide aminopeptidase